MNKKGFTLIELIGVVIILVLIFSLSFPVYLNMIKKNKENKQSSLEKDLCLAGKSYLYSNSDDININSFLTNKSGTYDITVQTLISNDLIDKMAFKNITLNNNYKVRFSFSSGDLNCVYMEG